METLVLENEYLKASFDSETGALVHLQNKATGWNIQNRASLGLSFRLLAPLPERRNNPVLGKKQKLAKSELSADGKRLAFLWKNPESEHGGRLDIGLKGIVTLNDQTLTFGMEVDNRSPYVVEAVSYPCLGDVPLPSPSEKLECLKNGYAGLGKVPLLPAFLNQKGYYGVDHPIQMHATPRTPFVLIAANSQGLYAGCHDTSAKELVQFTFELKPGYGVAHTNSYGFMPKPEEAGGRPVRLEFAVTHFPFLAPGEKDTLSPIVLAPYIGTWHKGVDHYKEWKRSWFSPPPVPEWAEEVHSWQQKHIDSPEDELRCQYKDLVSIGEECARHGVKAIQLVGWNRGGQDRGNPSHDTDPRLGTREELKEAIARIQEMEVKVVLFNKYTWAERSTRWFREELIDYACKDPYGDYYVYRGYQYQTPTQLSDINTRRLIPLCMNSKEWREIACREFEKGIELGADGMLYDECQHHGGARYCFDENHGHHVPAHVFAGDALLARDFRRTAGEKKPDYLFAGEACYDLEYQYYGISYFRFHTLEHIPVERYLNPHAGIMAAVTGFNDRAKLNACLVYRYIISYEPFNFKGRLEDFPLTIEYGKKVDALRGRYKEFLWEGEFRDIQGASVTVNGKPHRYYSVFRHAKEDRRAVVIANHDPEKEIEAGVKIDNASPPFMLATPEKTEPQESDGRITIPPASAAVLMEP